MISSKAVGAIGVIAGLLVWGTPAIVASGEKESSPREKLEAHSTEFRKEIINIMDGVHVAVGFGAPTSALIEGTDGVIIVDTMESTEAAEHVKAEFQKITQKPLKAIIYTHSHRDHVGGAKVFLGDDKIDIYGRANFSDVMMDEGRHAPAIQKRSVRQFGMSLTPKERLNIGVGPSVRPLKGLGAGYVPPTKTFSGDRMELEVSGVKMQLIAAPGETDDHLFVWLPAKKVLFCGDNYYKAFPNLYAIRGTKYRDVSQWADSLDKMIPFNAEYLVPGHTRPISGADQVRHVLTDYRDAIRFVLDKTIEGMNKGLTPDQLVEYVKLPPDLAKKPYLQEYYGVVAWSVRGIFDGLMGWFDGNPTNLFPLRAREEAERMAEMAGGRESLLNRAKKALAVQDYQWASQLSDYLLALDPKSAEVKVLKADVLEALAEQQISANARNYYFSVAKELRKQAESRE